LKVIEEKMEKENEKMKRRDWRGEILRGR